MAMARDSTHSDLRLDEALFMLPAEGLGSVGAALGRTRLRTFVGLRWIAVLGQLTAVIMVGTLLGFDIPMALCLAIISASAWLNVFLATAFQTRRLASEGESFAQLAFDTLQLAALIAATGGLANPFLMLLIAPVFVASVSLRPIYAATLAVLVLGIAASMPAYALDLPWRDGADLALPALFQWGQYAALAVGVLFFALTALRLSHDQARLVRALDAAQVVMAREQRLSALGAMAAMTAHELGTPLATIHLVAREMARDLPPDSPHAEDVALLAEQAERCRNILRTLAQERKAGDIIHAQMPLSTLVEEASAPHKGLGVEVRVRTRREAGGEETLPIVARSPEVLHALGAFIENAVSFAETEVAIEASWNAEDYAVTIIDDGPGFSAEILPKLGEPYVSERGAAQAGGGDMGLGFFIAKTLVERTGGRIAMRNRPSPEHGAVVQAIWPRAALDPQTETPILN